MVPGLRAVVGTLAVSMLSCGCRYSLWAHTAVEAGDRRHSTQEQLEELTRRMCEVQGNGSSQGQRKPTNIHLLLKYGHTFLLYIKPD